MSKIEVNTVAPQCGTTLTLGESGDTVVLGTGANQSGFGRSGSVNWQTTPKTATFTAVDGEGYFINSGSAITVNLPAGSAGAIIAVSDYARNFATYNLTITANGSEKIGGQTGSAILNVNGQAATFVYVDSTKGWINVQNAEDTEAGASFITATGGTITTVCTNYKVHTFTSPGTFTVCSVGNAAGSNEVSYMVVAGGGAAGTCRSGGGGAGGFREGRTPQCNSWTASPIACTSGCNAGLPVSAQGYPIVVGAGGTSPGNRLHHGGCGSVSSFSTISSAGGGGGQSDGTPGSPGKNGGSGGGGSNSGNGGTGNTPPVSPAQGTNGGPSTGGSGGGGGGGATAAGATGNNPAGAGGAGATSSINGTPTARAGGGGGGSSGSGAPGGAGGGGCGVGGGNPTGAGGAGTANTGGGGGGTSEPGSGGGGAGGSGIVIIRYRFQ